MRSDQGNVGGLACSDLICPLGICKLKKGPDYNSGNKIKKIKLKLKRYPQCNPSQRIIITFKQYEQYEHHRRANYKFDRQSTYPQ